MHPFPAVHLCADRRVIERLRFEADLLLALRTYLIHLR